MKITGEQNIPAVPGKVWKALNDPEVLRQTIPGCKCFERNGHNTFKTTIETKIGPVRAVFNGDVRLSDLDPPHGYTLLGRGTAGSLGNAKGSARVRLVPNGAGTKLTYNVDAAVSGKFAQLGSRLLHGTANLLADQFFTRFGEIVSGRKTTRAWKAAMPWRVWALVALAIVAAAAA